MPIALTIATLLAGTSKEFFQTYFYCLWKATNIANTWKVSEMFLYSSDLKTTYSIHGACIYTSWTFHFVLTLS